ncbi:MAG: tRNA 2-selenouridine(34) synthase MnmH [Proteobacteria bacterium]|nr:tRNA 2-selenouridine(34) synthase MnmH [Pseudomonadota bacterium]
MSLNYYQGPLKALFSDNVPLIDVRAPVEFENGAFPHALNLPLLDNGQRHEIGICYKAHGQKEAIALGHRLVCGPDKSSKIEKWINEIESNPDCVLYCLRGGLRSQISQSWILEEGKNVPIIKGGYKRLRNYLINNLEDSVKENSFLVISGNTGSGKTRVLNKLSKDGYKAIDLEGLANHRGSAFGQNPTPQPSQVSFENGISIQFIKEEKKDSSVILFEDESIMIGQLQIPRSLYDKKKQSPIFVLRIPKEERVELILEDYVKAVWPRYEKLENRYEQFFDYFKLPFDRIKKRLGGLVHEECLLDLQRAVSEQEKSDSFLSHRDWINKLLIHYYDPLYERGLAKKKSLVIGEGGAEELRVILNSYSPEE